MLSPRASKKIIASTAIYMLIYMAFVLMLAIWCESNWNASFAGGYAKAVFPWIIASLIINVCGFVFVKKVGYVDMGLLYVLCSYLFMFGHVYIDVLNLKTTLTWNPAIYFSDSVKFHASIYVVLCLSVISWACLLVKYPKESYLQLDEEQNAKQRKVMLKTGWLFLAIGFVANAINSGKIIMATLATGSYASYTTANTEGIIDDLAYLLVPGILNVFCSKTLSKRKNGVLLIAAIAYFIITMVFSGSRKTQIFAIATILLCYLWTQKREKITAKKLIVLIICGILFLNLIYVIRENRFDLVTIVPKYFESLGSFKFIGAIVGETFAEAGLSFYSVVAIIDNVPSHFSYELGMTLIRTIPSILPIGWAVGDFFNKAASSYVINRYTGLPVGTSILGDFYWNWGFIVGIIASFIFGTIISKTTNRTLSVVSKEPVYFSVLYILLIGIRAGIFELFRPLIMVTLVPYIIKLLLFGRNCR
ncbi:MAG: O-antigen ligase [Desulfitobacterium hafniense]|nr:O-antigen ligase [Desulfitobacterium hafniense]